MDDAIKRAELKVNQLQAQLEDLTFKIKTVTVFWDLDMRSSEKISQLLDRIFDVTKPVKKLINYQGSKLRNSYRKLFSAFRMVVRHEQGDWKTSQERQQEHDCFECIARERWGGHRGACGGGEALLSICQSVSISNEIVRISEKSQTANAPS